MVKAACDDAVVAAAAADGVTVIFSAAEVGWAELVLGEIVVKIEVLGTMVEKPLAGLVTVVLEVVATLVEVGVAIGVGGDVEIEGIAGTVVKMPPIPIPAAETDPAGEGGDAVGEEEDVV
jgi:hypothetical protein